MSQVAGMLVQTSPVFGSTNWRFSAMRPSSMGNLVVGERSGFRTARAALRAGRVYAARMGAWAGPGSTVPGPRDLAVLSLLGS